MKWSNQMQDEIREEGCGASCACGASASPLTSPIDRRKFVSLGAYAAAASALAACAGAGSTDATAPTSLARTIKVSDYTALATVGGVATTTLNGSPVAIVRVSATSFLALSRVCPHQGSTIDTTSTGFRCPNHGATFDASGNWIGGQRTSSMRSYTTIYDSGAGTLTIG